MVFKDSKGREVYLSFYFNCDSDDIQCDHAAYSDDDSLPSDSEIESIMREYAGDILVEWEEYQISRAEAYGEGMER